MARSSSPPPPRQPAKLREPREAARASLSARVELGHKMLDAQRSINSAGAFELGKRDFGKRDDYNAELLRRMFTTEEYSSAYNDASYYGSIMMSMGGRNIADEINDHIENFDRKLTNLESLTERLDLIESEGAVIEAARAIAPAQQPAKSSRSVFVVHGHDGEMKSVVARFLSQCDLVPIILHEQPNQGRTVIEKFEHNADVKFAVVLLTPDDIGGAASPDGSGPVQPRRRARQNVILELGYFTGKLGRAAVFALQHGNLELPSDVNGVVYETYDGPDGGWRVKLAKEIKFAGIEVDMNKVFL
jgi:predicted nucleotide-binding protein